MASKKPKFLRRTSSRYSKLGKGRKKKQIWRRPTGRHNKMRNKRNGYPVIVSIGYGTKKIGEERIIVNNVRVSISIPVAPQPIIGPCFESDTRPTRRNWKNE